MILEALPDEFDSRVKAMEVDEKPTEEFNDVGGIDSQIQERDASFDPGLARARYQSRPRPESRPERPM